MSNLPDALFQNTCNPLPYSTAVVLNWISIIFYRLISAFSNLSGLILNFIILESIFRAISWTLPRYERKRSWNIEYFSYRFPYYEYSRATPTTSQVILFHPGQVNLRTLLEVENMIHDRKPDMLWSSKVLTSSMVTCVMRKTRASPVSHYESCF